MDGKRRKGREGRREEMEDEKNKLVIQKRDGETERKRERDTHAQNERERERERLILSHVRRKVPLGIIQMTKGAIDKGDALEDMLETFAEIVTVAERGGRIEDDIDLDVQSVADMIGLDALDALDGAREAHRQVEQDVDLVRAGRGTREILNVRGRGAGPVHDDVER